MKYNSIVYIGLAFIAGYFLATRDKGQLIDVLKDGLQKGKDLVNDTIGNAIPKMKAAQDEMTNQ